MKVIDDVKELLEHAVVFGQPYEKNGLTVIPAARVMGGGGGGEAPASEKGTGSTGSGGGAGVQARPAGAFVVKGDSVRWVPAVDANRMILMGQILGIVALLSWRSVAKARARGKVAAAK